MTPTQIENYVKQWQIYFAKKGYAFFTQGDYNLNIIAIRENDIFENTFSDTLLVLYKVNQKWQIFKTKWTTLAGVYGLGGEQNPLTKWQTGTDLDGVAIIAEGQYRGAFEYVNNGFNYPFTEYLRQIKALNYWRDNNKNFKIDRNPLTFRTGIYETHLHAMSHFNTDGIYISFPGYSPWSQGCQGAPSYWFNQFLSLVREAVKIYGKRFTYTLVHRNELSFE